MNPVKPWTVTINGHLLEPHHADLLEKLVKASVSIHEQLAPSENKGLAALYSILDRGELRGKFRPGYDQEERLG